LAGRPPSQKPNKARDAMSRKLFSTLLALLSLVCLTVGSGATANATSLANLIEYQGTIIVGDKQFSNFQATLTPSGPTTAPPDLTGITVTGITISGNNGLEFTGGLFAGAGSSLDLLLSYDVTVLDPNFMISDIHLIFNGSVTGTGFTNVTETVLTLDQTSVLGQVQVTNPPPDFDNIILIDPPVSAAHVKKDIFLFGSGSVDIPGTATISFIDQVVSQTAIPEPSSLFLLGTGIMGLAARLRRRG